MNPLKTLVLAVVLLGVGAYIRYVELPQEEHRKQEEFFLKGIREQSLKSISITREGKSFSLVNQKPTEVKKDASSSAEEDLAKSEDWKIEGLPASATLDSGAFRSLLSGLTSLKLGDAIPPDEAGSDLKVFGLDTPALTVRLGLPSGEKTLLFGKRQEFVGKRYAKVADDGLYMVDDTLFSSANKERDEFREKMPIKLDLEEFKSIDLESSDGPVRVEKSEGGSWKIVKSEALKADQQFVMDFVRRIRALHVKEFVDPPAADQLSQFGLDKPDVVVKLAGDKRTLEVKLAVKIVEATGEETKNDTSMYFWFNESPSVYKIEGNQINLFRLPAESFRDKHVLEVERDKLSKIEISQNGKATQVLEKADGGWKLDGAQTDSSGLNTYLDKLVEFEVDRYASPQDVSEDFGDPVARLTIRQGDSEAIWEIGPESKGQPGNVHPVRRAGGPLLGFISAQKIDDITPQKDYMVKDKAEKSGATTS